MADDAQEIAELLREDSRYKFEAYAFVFEALNYAHKELGMGAEKTSERAGDEPTEEVEEEGPERHLTGQQLCDAIRQYALEQYGYMAKCVLNSWGVHATGDFGEIVFNLIRIKKMKKTTDDRREDFNDVFDFDSGLQQNFKITKPG
jgi:uncharacterized repeat protein (TIGR04138 family)